MSCGEALCGGVAAWARRVCHVRGRRGMSHSRRTRNHSTAHVDPHGERDFVRMCACARAHCRGSLALALSFFWSLSSPAVRAARLGGRYSKAAQAGSSRGAYSLGYMYERGLGAPRSEVRAERHYERAAQVC